MGQLLSSLLCTFAEAGSPQARHEELVARLQANALTERRFIPILVLGLPGSGKSLLIAQLAASFSAPPHLLSGAAADDAAAAAAMRDATVDSARALARAALATGEPFGSASAADAAALLVALPQGCALTAVVAEATAHLWGSGGRAVALAWDAVSAHCSDNFNYLVRRAKAQSARGFAPSAEDRLRLHLPTLHPMRTLLRERGAKNVLHLAEVPGCVLSSAAQLSCAVALLQESALALIFCCALSDFDRTEAAPAAGLALEPPRNRLVAALDAWEAVARSPHFERAHITLLLTKQDAFTDKLETIDLRHPGSAAVPPRFLDYRGGADAGAALAYLEARFHERAAGRAVPVRIQATNLLDPKRVAALCTALKDHARHIKEEELTVLDSQ